jgi:hypothetical protein
MQVLFEPEGFTGLTAVRSDGEAVVGCIDAAESGLGSLRGEEDVQVYMT